MDASLVSVAEIDDIPADNLQNVLATVYGKAQWAAETAGTVQGQAQWAADQVGFLDYHLRQIAAIVGYTVPPAP